MENCGTGIKRQAFRFLMNNKRQRINFPAKEGKEIQLLSLVKKGNNLDGIYLVKKAKDKKNYDFVMTICYCDSCQQCIQLKKSRLGMNIIFPKGLIFSNAFFFHSKKVMFCV